MIRIIMFLLTLTACSTSNSYLRDEQDFKPGIFQAEDLSFYEPVENKNLHIGMSKDEVEAELGKPIDTIDFMGLYEYPGLKIHYKDNYVNALIIDDNTQDNNKFITARRIKYRDSV